MCMEMVLCSMSSAMLIKYEPLLHQLPNSRFMRLLGGSPCVPEMNSEIEMTVL